MRTEEQGEAVTHNQSSLKVECEDQHNYLPIFSTSILSASSTPYIIPPTIVPPSSSQNTPRAVSNIVTTTIMCKGNKEEEENGSVRGSDNHSNGKEDDDNSWRSSSSILRKLRQQLNEHMPASFSDNNKNDSTNDDDKSSSVSISKKERRQATDTVTTKAREATEAVSEEAKLRERQEQIIWRDFTFLVVALLAGCVMSFVEMNVADVAIRGGGPNDESRGGILDAGFILTKPLHDYLEQNRGMNDLLAAINSLIGVLGPFAYMGYQTAWVGDFDPIFRYLAISAIRSLCGWVTFLPPDKSYLASHYDFPDIAQCLIKDCGDPTHAELSPFVTFFSGHVGKCRQARKYDCTLLFQ